MPSITGSVGNGGVNRASDVRIIQNLLNAHRVATPALMVDGKIGSKTTGAIRSFQTRVVRMSLPDGRVDPGGRTLAALNGRPMAAPIYQYPAGPQEPLADIARPYIGAREAPGNRMGSDPRMREIFEADWLTKDGDTDGYPWCCSFVTLCVQKLIRQTPFYGHLHQPRTASVSNFRTGWAVQNHCLIFSPNDPAASPHKGDVVVYTFSHIGIVDEPGQGSVFTIEGNTNERGSREGTAVERKTRPFGQVRCFIRFPLPATFDFARQMCVA
jgi:hypothetical protein